MVQEAPAVVCEARLGPPLARSFYLRPTLEVAQDLIGRFLVHRRAGEPALIGRIVEAEAYGPDDPASHAYRGPRPGNATMFGRGGLLYVYRSHGIHWCANAVTQDEGIGEAVLLRALEPLAGLEAMRARRGGVEDRRLCGGPGCLCRAFGVSKEHDGADLTTGALTIHSGGEAPGRVVAAPRIGLTRAVERPWRFVLAGSRFASRPVRVAP